MCLIDFGLLCFHFHLYACIYYNFFFGFFSGSLVAGGILLALLSVRVFSIFFFLYLISSLTAWGGKRCLVWFQFSKTYWGVLWSCIWSILETIPYALEKNVYSAAFWWHVHICVFCCFLMACSHLCFLLFDGMFTFNYYLQLINCVILCFLIDFLSGLSVHWCE